jgi:hypothetical protein
MVKFPKLLTNIWKLKQAFHGLTRRIQTTVEHMRVTNTTTDMVRGEVIALTAGSRQAIRSDADSASAVEWAGVMAEDVVAGATGIARINGYAFVLFEDALDPAPAAEDAVYVSQVAGRATNKAVAGPAFVNRIGTVDNSSVYATTGGCWVFLQHCCTPVQVDR